MLSSMYQTVKSLFTQRHGGGRFVLQRFSSTLVNFSEHKSLNTEKIGVLTWI